MFTQRDGDDAAMAADGLDLAAAPAPVERPRSFRRPADRSGPVPAAAAGRYGEGRRFNPSAILLVVGLHAALGMALIQARSYYVKKKEAELIAVNLMPPPPPPLEEAPPPPPVEATVPIPKVVLPTPAPVAATPDPTPAPPVQQAPPAPPAPPVPPAPPSVVNSGNLSAQMVAGKPPRYPIESRRKREQGTVVLLLIVGTDGRVESISVSKSSGFARLDDAALSAVRGWRWQPVIRAGQAAKVRGLVEIPFVIQG